MVPVSEKPDDAGDTLDNAGLITVSAGVLDRFDVLIQPGGSGSAQAKALEEEGRDKIRKFVDGGGGYLGICAGSYLAWRPNVEREAQRKVNIRVTDEIVTALNERRIVMAYEPVVTADAREGISAFVEKRRAVFG